MILKSLSISFCTSIVSLLVVSLAPLTIHAAPEVEPSSPYRQEITELLEKGNTAGWTNQESERFDELSALHDEWYAQYKEAVERGLKAAEESAWLKKSAIVAPAVAVVWGVVSFLFFRRESRLLSLLVLTFPVVFFLTKVVSLVELVATVSVVVVIRVLCQMRPPSSTKPP